MSHDAAAAAALAGSCRRLRFKGMFIEADPDPTVPASRDDLCWCTRTMTCLGPDGQVAGRDACGEGRGCYESR
jgi:hypothetical protein